MTKVSHCHGAVNDSTHSVDTRRNEQLSHVSFTCFNTVIWLAAHFFVRPNVNTQTALTLPGPIPLQKGVGPGNEATLSQDTRHAIASHTAIIRTQSKLNGQVTLATKSISPEKIFCIYGYVTPRT